MSLKPTSKAHSRPTNRNSSMKSKTKSQNIKPTKISSNSSDTDEVAASAKKPSSSSHTAEEDQIPLASSDDSSESDSEGSEVEDEDAPRIDVAKLPVIAKDDASISQKLKAIKARAKEEDERGTIYLGRIPHGFYEDEMKAYFSQFGDVTRLRLSRNKKTGKSKHYAFIEFSSGEVAQIVQETMDNYLLMGHILRCTLLNKDDIHPSLWIGSNKKWRNVHGERVERQRFNQPRTEEQQQRAEKKLLSRQEAKKRKLEELGISYDMSSIEYKKAR